MSPTDDNSLASLANSTSPNASSSFRRRATRHAIISRRFQFHRRHAPYHLSLECLEPRFLLSGMAELFDLSGQVEASEPPAVMVDFKCTSSEIAIVEPVASDIQDTAEEDEATADVVQDPDDENGDEPVEIQSCGFRDPEDVANFLGQQYPSKDMHFEEDTLSRSSDFALNILGTIVSTSQSAGPMIPQLTSSEATTNLVPQKADPELARPAAVSQQPVYFSGATTLSGARWKVSVDELTDADALLEVVGLEENDGTASPDVIAAELQVPVVPAESAAIVALPQEITPASNELDALAEAFAQVDSWTETATLPQSRKLAATKTSRYQPTEHLLRSLLPASAGDLFEALRPVEASESAANELATVSLVSPFGRVPSWYLVGGFGLWQIILSVRSRNRKQSQENQV